MAPKQTAAQAWQAAWLGWLDAQRAQLPLWLPVMLAAGIALWFALPWAPWRQAAMLAATALAGGAALARWRLLAASALMLALGLAAVELRVAMNAHAVLAQRQFTQLHGTVAAVEPLPFGAQRLIIVADAGHRPDGVERLRLRLPAGQPALLPGSRIAVRALLSPPAAAAVPGGYDVARRAWFDGIGASGVALGPVAVTAMPAAGLASGLASGLAGLRSAIQARITAAVPGEAGAVAAAFVTGQQGAIPPATAQAMRDAGLAHLLSISGLHIAVVVGTMAWLLRRTLALSPWLALRVPVPTLALAGGALAGLAYTLLAGAQVPTVRAVTVAGIVVLGMMLGRQALSLRLVAAAAAAILLVRPEALLGASFQMSFAAVIGIIALYESPLGRWLGASQEDEAWWHWLARHGAALLATGLVAEAALAGIGLYHFGRSGLYGVLANLLAIPWTSLVAMPALMLALLGEAVGIGWGWPLAGWALQRLIDLADVTAAMPGAVIVTGAVPGPAFAVAAAGGLWLALWRGGSRWLGLAGVAAGVALALASPPPDVLINADGRQLAVRLADGRLAHARGRMGDWLLDNMAEAMGSDPADALWLGQVAGARCSEDACVADILRGSRRWRLLAITSRYLLPRSNMEPVCRAADVVVADRRLPAWCRPRWLKLDRTSLAQTGAVAIWLDGRRVAVAADAAGDRPWRPIRR
ncbi:MAG: ComEC/Rec2 family competence protein [Alphaproteobacteria bacterium]|nr:ComEC/Rec2 family competence protein [Alphaproteobacteria bacterium]